MLCCIFQEQSRVVLNRNNCFKYGVLTSRRKDYLYSAGLSFDHLDFSWREFALQFTPLLGNWLRLTKNEMPQILSETADCLNILHDNCAWRYTCTSTLFKIQRLNRLVEYLEDFSIIKYLKEEDHHDLMFYQTCSRLKKTVGSICDQFKRSKKIC